MKNISESTALLLTEYKFTKERLESEAEVYIKDYYRGYKAGLEMALIMANFTYDEIKKL